MRFGEIEIPNELIEAQKNNKLVVFAGAGVSNPAGVPDFDELVNKIDRKFRAPEDPEYQELPADKKLGILASQGKPIHEYVRAILKDYFNPCSLHKLLLELFKSDQKIRLVTTNFDNLFSIAYLELRTDELKHHLAPSLPPGDRFYGIAQVHGSVTSDSADLVLTDSDFGRAYLTEGWARRFLLGMFESSTVLFYGYGHHEIILGYLARALPADSQRFSFSSKSDEDKWRSLGVNPIICPDSSDDPHKIEEECLRKWRNWTQGSYTWFEKTLQKITSQPLPPDKETGDIVLKGLEDLSITRLFTKYATDPEWLRWLNDKEVLEPLFDPYHNLSVSEHNLSSWIAEKFVIDHPKSVIKLISKHGDQMSSGLWHSVLRQITHSKKRPDKQTFNEWLTLILNNQPLDAYHSHKLDYLLQKLRWPENKLELMRLFSYLLTPKAYTQESFGSIVDGSETPKYEFRLTLKGDNYFLSKSWTTLKPNISEFWRTLLLTVQKHIADAYQLNLAHGQATEDSDRELFWRSAIEVHEQDEDQMRSFDVLIDCARDMLEYLLTTDELKSEGKSFVEAWIASGVPFLRRIAIHGVAYGDSWSADEKIRWLLDKDLIYRNPFKHETYQAIKSALANCGKGVT
ncbi:MAG: SIR2 family protein, partial [Proteobacteria bacterium]|nr:SIR2 family protein [Pseudomonadota bacterium]